MLPSRFADRYPFRAVRPETYSKTFRAGKRMQIFPPSQFVNRNRCFRDCSQSFRFADFLLRGIRTLPSASRIQSFAGDKTTACFSNFTVDVSRAQGFIRVLTYTRATNTSPYNRTHVFRNILTPVYVYT